VARPDWEGVFNLKKLRKLKMGKKGIAALELALILPILLILVFGIIDFGRLIRARLIVTNVSREGGSMASRSFKSGDDLLTMLQSSGAPLDLNGLGKIYISRIRMGKSLGSPNPYIDLPSSVSKGNLGVSSAIGSGLPRLGLSDALYQHLKFEGPPQNTSDISEVWVVQVYYKYKPITPLPNFITGILVTPGIDSVTGKPYDGMIIGSKSVF
jgi:hypothetical protein